MKYSLLIIALFFTVISGCGNNNTAAATNSAPAVGVDPQVSPADLLALEPSKIADWKEWLGKYESVVKAYIESMLRAGYPQTNEPSQEVVNFMTVVTKFAMDMPRISSGIADPEEDKVFSDKVNEINDYYEKAGLKN
ncbi:MAG: hypothetical protein A2Y33_02165 [Spirochaetes bacterium GWF1_51_8]|nr:MAG: hypothetical protein A2Y33_02165 [Spirochaetes bacterium GWF1_51_8]